MPKSWHRRSNTVALPGWSIFSRCSGGRLVGLFRSHAAREAEDMFLRHQLLVLRRSAPAPDEIFGRHRCSCQAVEPTHHQQVTGGKLREQPMKSCAIGPRSARHARDAFSHRALVRRRACVSSLRLSSPGSALLRREASGPFRACSRFCAASVCALRRRIRFLFPCS
jgi:hypothetical protein